MLTEKEWKQLQDIRLTALQESPHAFLASHGLEETYSEEKWRAEFTRGEWIVAVSGDKIVGFLGITHETTTDGRHLEYLWVAPEARRTGVASALLTEVFEHLQDSGVSTVWLWILDGNEPARCLYERFGFLSTDERQPLPMDSNRSEERMMRRLP
jgi:ribosomal protein S18 acetylase RimI-like enzyme